MHRTSIPGESATDTITYTVTGNPVAIST
jgi:flagellar capping protein FliD